MAAGGYDVPVDKIMVWYDSALDLVKESVSLWRLMVFGPPIALIHRIASSSSQTKSKANGEVWKPFRTSKARSFLQAYFATFPLISPQMLNKLLIDRDN